jgi:hypothetical protein
MVGGRSNSFADHTGVLAYPPPGAGLLAAVGTLGFIACAIFAYYFGEHLERKVWLPIGAAITLVGGILIAIKRV